MFYFRHVFIINNPFPWLLLLFVRIFKHIMNCICRGQVTFKSDKTHTNSQVILCAYSCYCSSSTILLWYSSSNSAIPPFNGINNPVFAPVIENAVFGDYLHKAKNITRLDWKCWKHFLCVGLIIFTDESQRIITLLYDRCPDLDVILHPNQLEFPYIIHAHTSVQHVSEIRWRSCF